MVNLVNYVELSIKKLEEENKKLYNLIKKDYSYDCVIFVAKGSYLIGRDLAKYNDTPLLEIRAKRRGGKIKKIISPLLQFIPKKMKLKLRSKEVNSNYHDENSERFVVYDELIYSNYKKIKKILLVDDSIDTGNTLKAVLRNLKDYFKDAEIKVAALNVFDKSKRLVNTDFTLYENTILIGPWSNDSKEHSKYNKMYEEWQKKYSSDLK